jgi:EmrB/QacA subfamily drug resistance transporter
MIRPAPVTRRTVTPPQVLWVASFGTALAFADTTMVSVAFPDIQRDFDETGFAGISWVLTVYGIVFAAFVVAAGRIAELLGRKRLYEWGLLLFTLASGLCAAAPSVELLVVARGLQALGAAVVVPASLALVLETFPESDRGRGLALWSGTAALAAGLGLSLGGLLVEIDDWRLIFLIDLPTGALALLASERLLVESRAPGRRAAPDLVGALLLAAAAAGLTLGIVQGEEWGWASPAIVALLMAAAVAFAAFVIFELRIAAAPMADLRLFARRSFAATGFVAFAISATVTGMIIYLSLYVQNSLGYSPVGAGLRFLPLSLVSFAVALLTGRLIGRVGMRVLLGVAMVAAAAGLASMAHLTATSTWLVLLPGLILAGIGLGITSTGLASAALAAVEPAHAGMAAGLVNTLRQVGTATGVAVLGALYASRVTTATLNALAGLPAPPGAARRLAAAVASGAGTRAAGVVPPAARAAVTHAARAGTASGLNDVLLAAAAFAAAGAIAGFVYGPDPAKQPTSGPAPGELSALPASAEHRGQRPARPETTAP